jgi:hypothetical protein
MDSEYLCNHLKKLSSLIYKGEPFALVNERGKYVFGDENNRNIVTKPIAIYLSIEKIVKNEETTQKRKRTKKVR